MSANHRQTAAVERHPTGPNFLDLVDEERAGSVVTERAAEIRRALSRAIDGPIELAWIQGQSCSGCTVSLLQSADPTIEETLSELREGVSFHSTLMVDAGDDAMSSLESDPDVLVVEGAVPTRIPRAATLGVDAEGNPKPVLDWVLELGERADVVVAAGTCAAFGGLPAAGRFDSADVGESPTGARGLQFDGREAGGVFGPAFETGRNLPVINVPGCPLYAEHLLVTLATVLNGHAPALDEYNRPLPLFGPLVHDDCELREEYESLEFADEPGGEGCLYDAGCAGVYARCDGSKRLRNGGTSICRQVGAPCIGCVEPAFWDRFSPFYEAGRDDDGEPAAPGDEVPPPTEATPDRSMSAVGAVTGCLAAAVALPAAPFVALTWLYDRVRGDDEPTGWEDLPL